MEGHTLDLYVFGDQTAPFEQALQDLLLTRDHPLVTRFLTDVFTELHDEIEQLSALERKRIPWAETLGLLIGKITAGQRHAGLDSALVCAFEIAQYLCWLDQKNETHPPLLSAVLGICTGSFVASAASCAQSATDIVRLGLQSVRVAFRIGMLVHRQAQMVDQKSAHESWSFFTPGVSESTATNILLDFCQTHHIALTSAPYVSAVSLNGITVSGSPSTLSALLSTPAFERLRPHKLSIVGPYHCPSLYKNHTMEHIVFSITTDIKYLDRPTRLANISCATGLFTTDSTFGELLAADIRNVLSQQIRLDAVVSNLCKMPISQLISISSTATSGIASALSQKEWQVPVEFVGRQRTQTTDSDSPMENEKIAIVGYSGRFPEADCLAEFWDILKNGLDVNKPVPADRFDWQAHYDATGQRRNTSKVSNGAWLKNPGLFDAPYFHLSPREASQADPAQRLALLTACEALDMAGFVVDRTPSSMRHRVGVFYGTTSDDWREVNSGQDIDTYFIPGGNRAFIPGRINYHFKFSGPSVSVDTACSSSLAAINVATQSLLKRDCDTAIAGGTNVMTNPDNFAGLDRGHFLSHNGNCKTFDDSADGYCRAEAVGTVVLKRLRDAVTDCDPIFGVILGALTNHSAEAVSITRPLADAQEHLFKRLLNESGVAPHDVSYIEMHGTGTQAGDAVEMKSVLNTFAPDHSRGTSKSLHLGSVKSNVGHGESASGVTALIKVLMMMEKSKIPPHCGIQGQINQGFPKDLAQRGVNIAIKEADWKRSQGGKRRVFVNNFSAAGGNTALLLEDSPLSEKSVLRDSGTHHVVTVSAHSAKSLEKNLLSLGEFIGEQTSHELLAQISYTTTARRVHHSRRITLVAQDLQQLRSQLSKCKDNAPSIRAIPAEIPRIGFLFTGQGAQHTAMAESLYVLVSSFKANILEYDALVQTLDLPSFLPLIDGSLQLEQLSPMVIQLGTCAVQIALAQYWISLGLSCQYVAGHSLGEYAALVLAGVLSIRDALWLCGHRAQLLSTRCPPGTHGMVSVQASVAQLHSILESVGVEVSCINGPDATVLGGSNASLQAICEQLSKLNLRFTKLPLPFAFHTSQVDEILDDFEVAASRVSFQPASMPIISPLLAKVIEPGQCIDAHYLRRHCRETMDFNGAVQIAFQEKTMQSSDVCIEIGTHPLLSKMVQKILSGQIHCHPSLHRNEGAFKTLSDCMSALHDKGIKLDWNEYHRDFPISKRVIQLPHYSWDLRRYWIDYDNNFCLTKGSKEPVKTLPSAPKVVHRLSDAVQEIIKQTDDAQVTSLTIQSNLHDPALLPLAQDHQVCGLMMLPSSLYADMALTMVRYLANTRKSSTTDMLPNLCNVVVEKAVIVQPTGPQLIQASATMEWSSLSGKVEFFSTGDAKGSRTLHASCNFRLEEPRAWLREWQRHDYLIQRSVQHLQDGVRNKSVHHLRRGMVYKLFSQAVHYGPLYQGIEDVALDSENLEACAKVRLRPSAAPFGINGNWIDSFGHLTGFIMNANDVMSHDEHVYINHGWSSMRCSEPFSSDATYTTYVRMRPLHGDDSAYSGDVWILREDKIVALYEGVTFNKIKRKVLETLLGRLGKPTQRMPATAGQPQQISHAFQATATSTQTSTKPTAKPLSRPELVHSDVVFEQVLQAIADEIGVQRVELKNETEFVDFGVDSLMSLTILSLLRDRFNVEAPASLFDEYPTVQALRAWFSRSTMTNSSDNSSSASEADISTGASSVTTRPDVDETYQSKQAINDKGAQLAFVFAIMGEEIGLGSDELSSSDDLSSCGVDSLLSLTIIGRLQDELGIDLPSDFFLVNTTGNQVKTSLQRLLGARDDGQDTRQAETSGPGAGTVATNSSSTSARHPPATSVILSGGKTSSKRLFLFPDGSGSSSSYMGLPALPKDLCLIGLNCPYMRRPQDMNCSLQDLTDPYITEIRRRQPHGPYSIGGWSAGGIAAYDAAQRLLDAGEAVDQLVLLDSPNPIGLGKLPPHFYKYLEDAGVFGGDGGAKAPEWLIQHFLAFIEALDTYKPVPLRIGSGAAEPQVTIIWATNGVCEDAMVEKPRLQPGDPKEIPWLLEHRADLGYNGWDRLLRPENIQIELIHGANHFTLVRQPFAASLVEVLKRVMRV